MSTTITPTLEIPWGEPRELIAGTTWLWNKLLEQFPSSTWILKYNIRGVGVLDLTATPDEQGISYQVVAAASASVALSSGAYTWFASVTNNASPTPTGEVYPVGQGDFQILANPANAIAGQLQPEAEVQLIAVNAEIRARLGLSVPNTPGGAVSAATSPGSAHNEIEIAGRRLDKIPLKGKGSLYELRAALLNEIARLEYGGTLPPSEIHFGRRRGFQWDGP